MPGFGVALRQLEVLVTLVEMPAVLSDQRDRRPEAALRLAGILGMSMTILIRDLATSVIQRASIEDVLDELANRIQGGESVDRALIMARYPAHAEALGGYYPRWN